MVTAMPVSAQQNPPQTQYGTHDQTLSVGERGFNEWMVDAKCVGHVTEVAPPRPAGMQNGARTYSAGTIEVMEVTGSNLFSGSPVQRSSGLPLCPAGSANRQVVIVQCTDDIQRIVWQKYFYGTTGTNYTRATNARGISVWPADNDSDTRIAICGETYDQVIPSSQSSTGWQYAGPSHATGFIAVYDGTGLLLWTHHFFNNNSSDQDCAITDVSVRVEYSGASPSTDVVTYCGISTHGVPSGASTDPLTPLHAFASPGVSYASGSTNNGTNQWDGMVGRLTRPHTPASGPTTKLFHSVVGGGAQDGAFGIAEIDANRFALVASTSTSMQYNGQVFPYTTGVQLYLSFGYCMGALMIFDASGTPSSSLVLQNSMEIGSVGNEHTFARDVLVQTAPFGFRAASYQGPTYTSGSSMIWVVGSTDDANLMSTLPNQPTSPGLLTVAPGMGALQGSTDGFLLGCIDDPGATQPLAAWFGAYVGGTGVDALSGVSSWNEYPDYVVVTGHSASSPGMGASSDIRTASFFVDSSQFLGGTTLNCLANELVGGTDADYPTALGTANATTSLYGHAFSEYNLDNPAGGGIGVDPWARANVVGTTLSQNYPVKNGRAKDGQLNDAVRTVLAMVQNGVGRSDDTGTPPINRAPTGPYVGNHNGTWFTGTTTPICAVSTFGNQIGRAQPTLQRMLIDVEGTIPTGPPSLVVGRPPFSTANFGQYGWWTVQVNLPSSALPVMMPEGVEIWTTFGTPQYQIWPVLATDCTLAVPLSGLPGSGFTCAMQVMFYFPTATVPGGIWPNCNTPSQWVSTPCLWLNY